MHLLINKEQNSMFNYLKVYLLKIYFLKEIVKIEGNTLFITQRKDKKTNFYITLKD